MSLPVFGRYIDPLRHQLPYSVAGAVEAFATSDSTDGIVGWPETVLALTAAAEVGAFHAANLAGCVRSFAAGREVAGWREVLVALRAAASVGVTFAVTGATAEAVTVRGRIASDRPVPDVSLDVPRAVADREASQYVYLVLVRLLVAAVTEDAVTEESAAAA